MPTLVIYQYMRISYITYTVGLYDMCVYVCVKLYIRVCVYVCMCVCVCLCVYARVRMLGHKLLDALIIWSLVV